MSTGFYFIIFPRVTTIKRQTRTGYGCTAALFDTSRVSYPLRPFSTFLGFLKFTNRHELNCRDIKFCVSHIFYLLAYILEIPALKCDHFVGKVSSMGQSTTPTQPSIPPWSVTQVITWNAWVDTRATYGCLVAGHSL